MQKPLFGTLALALLAAACGDLPTPTASERTLARPSLSAADGSWTSDDEYERIAREEIPGFAGYVVEADGTPVVMLVDPGQRPAAERWARGQGARAASHAQVRVRKAQWDFATLREWQQKLIPLMDEGVVFASDVDEARNRVWLAVETGADAGRARAQAARLGVPVGMLDVEVRSKPRPRATLSDPVRPVVGGLTITNSGGGVCTIGLVAIKDGSPVIITASHCSTVKYDLDASQQYQPAGSWNRITGAEVEDPYLKTCGSWGFCRKSDAAAWSISSGIGYSLGRIARPLSYGANQPGSTDIDPLQPSFQIVGKRTSSYPVGTWLDKVGALSGWTRGQLTRACVMIRSNGVSYECQYITSTWSEEGDSGAAIFAMVGGNTIEVNGILWGGPDDNWGETWFSGIGGVEKDMNDILTLY
jgi:hypothetical protein